MLQKTTNSVSYGGRATLFWGIMKWGEKEVEYATYDRPKTRFPLSFGGAIPSGGVGEEQRAIIRRRVCHFA